jgi:membrane fusion protein YbhG
MRTIVSRPDERTITSRHMKKPFILLTIVGLAAAMGYWYIQATPGTAPSVIRVSGNIEITDVEVSFKIPGRVNERPVSEGESVKAGQIVAQLDAEDLVQEVAVRDAEVKIAQAVLAELVRGSRPEEIAQGEEAVRGAKADMQRLQADYERIGALYKKELVTSRDYDATKTAYDVARSKYREAVEQLKLLRQGPRVEKIDRARADLQRAKKILALAEIQVGYATLVSPLSGSVLSENVEGGEYVSPGTPVVTIGDLENAWLRAYIDETDLGRIKLGQEAQVTIDTYPGKTYDGRISFISEKAEFTPKTVQTEKERVKLVYRIKINISNSHMELKPGMPADAEIRLGEEE